MRFSLLVVLSVLMVSCSNVLEQPASQPEEIARIDGTPLRAGSTWSYTSHGWSHSDAIWWPGTVTITHDSLLYHGKMARRAESARYFVYEEDGSTSHWVPIAFGKWESVGYHWINLPVTSKPVADYVLDTMFIEDRDTVEIHATQRVEFLSSEVISFEQKSHSVTKTLVESEYTTRVYHWYGGYNDKSEYSRFVIYWSESLQLPVRVDGRMREGQWDEKEQTYYLAQRSLK